NAISNYADLAAWAGPRECLTRKVILGGIDLFNEDTDRAAFAKRALHFQNDLLVLRCFTYGDEDEAMGVHLLPGWLVVFPIKVVWEEYLEQTYFYFQWFFYLSGFVVNRYQA
ncbi:hypothetical protein JG688_00018110, partial [Phytophthora aleatoria]